MIKITEKKLKPFKGDNEEMVDYAWYKAERQEDKVVISFGSMNIHHEVGDVKDIPLEKREGKKGTYYVEIKST